MTTAVEAPVSGQSTRRLVLKIDVLLMPLLLVAYGLQFYDKAVLGSATLFGILKDLELTSQRYSQANACFYYGYLAGAVFFAFLSVRWKLNFFLGGAIVLWGIIVLLTPAIASWRGLYAQRVFLGFVESAVSPGFVHITRSWYSKQEQSMRLGIWYSATGIFSVFSGLINFGLGSASTSIAPWKLIFLVPGAITVVFGVVVLLLLPPSPTEGPILRLARYNSFDADEREAITDKIRRNLTGMGRSEWQMSQVVEGLLDVKVWLLFLMATAIYVTNGGVTVFGPILVKTIFNTTGPKAIALQAAGGATTAISIYVVAYAATRIRNARIGLLTLSCLPVIAGAVMCWKAHWKTHPATAYAGYLLIPIFGAPYVMLLSLSTANIAGPTKQAVATGAIFLGYCLGNIASSYILLPKERAAQYPTMFKIIVSVMCATILLSWILGLVMWLENRRRDRQGLTPSPRNTAAEEEQSAAGTTKDGRGETTVRADGEGEAKLVVPDEDVKVNEDGSTPTTPTGSARDDFGKRAASTGFQGLTDRQNVFFRYSL